MKALLPAILVIALSGCDTGPAAPDAGGRVGHWIEVLRKPDAKLRKEAAFRLGNLALIDPPAVVGALTAALKDENPRVRCEAILALLKCGPAANQVVGQLAEMERNDQDAQVRSYATKALNRLKQRK